MENSKNNLFTRVIKHKFGKTVSTAKDIFLLIRRDLVIKANYLPSHCQMRPIRGFSYLEQTMKQIYGVQKNPTNIQKSIQVYLNSLSSSLRSEYDRR